MAKQMGILPLSGPMGAISFYKSEGEYRAREKTGPSRKMVLTSRRFERTRENSAEFRRAVRAGMLVRYSLRYLLKVMKLGDSHVSGRLNGWLLKVLQADAVHGRGARTVSNGNLELLEDFAFHKDRSLNQVFLAGPVSSINSATGRMHLEIRPFDPRQRVQAPAGATHFKVVSVGAALDFDKEQYEEDFRETDYLSLEETVSDTIRLEHTPEVKAGQSLLLAMGVVFYVRGEHGRYERMNGGAMRVIQVASPSLPLLRDGGELVTREIINEGLTFPTVPEKENANLTTKTQEPSCLWCDPLGIIHEQVFNPLLRQVLKEAGG
jgi:hypothetical protein